MTASYWGCDIGGEGNTHLARISFNQVGQIMSVEYDSEGRSALVLARHVWDASTPAHSPIFLVLDASLSFCVSSGPGWRPADLLLQRFVDTRLRPHVKGRYSSRVVSPNGLMGHRQLELSEIFGAYFLVAETHPTICLALMGASPADLALYKSDTQALTQLSHWVLSTWFEGRFGPIGNHGQLDALVCSMVAAGIGGRTFPGLTLVTPVLGTFTDRQAVGLPSPQSPTPCSELQGGAPYYVLSSPENVVELFTENTAGATHVIDVATRAIGHQN